MAYSALTVSKTSAAKRTLQKYHPVKEGLLTKVIIPTVFETNKGRVIGPASLSQEE